MRVRDRVGLNTSPLLLRIMLGAILLWMGMGKILDTVEVQGSAAATLANMGVTIPGAPAPPTAPPPPTTTTNPPAAETPSAAPPKGGAHAPDHGFRLHLASRQAPPATPRFQSVDFPKPAKVRKLYTIALAIDAAAHPGATSSGSAKSPYFPIGLASGSWPANIAWGCALAESLSGVGLILGLLTRCWALLMAGRMAGAIWLTQIGPSLAAGGALLGFLPNHNAFDVDAWRTLVLQFALLMSSLALVFLGPGRASLDHAIFTPPRTDDEDDED